MARRVRPKRYNVPKGSMLVETGNSRKSQDEIDYLCAKIQVLARKARLPRYESEYGSDLSAKQTRLEKARSRLTPAEYFRLLGLWDKLESTFQIDRDYDVVPRPGHQLMVDVQDMASLFAPSFRGVSTGVAQSRRGNLNNL